MTAVVLINPKTPYNVGSVIRACSLYGVPTLRWTGKRIGTAEARRKAGTHLKGNRPRLPREERLRDYTGVDWSGAESDVVSKLAGQYALTPIAVEKREGSEWLDEFVHPMNALYVFGPEDGSIPQGVLAVCHRFVRIPTVQSSVPLNLAAAVNVVLYDRLAKERAYIAKDSYLREVYA